MSAARRLCILLFAAALAGTAQAQQHFDSAAVAVRARHLKAIGGEEALRSQRWSRYRMRTVFPTGGQAETEVSVEYGKQVRLRVWVGNTLQVDRGMSRGVAWEAIPTPGVLSDTAAIQNLRYYLQRPELLDADLRRLEFLGARQFDGRPAIVVRVVGGEAVGEFVEYFHPETGLRMGRTHRTGDREMTILYEDYRRFGRLLAPAKSVMRFGENEMVMRLLEMSDAPIAPEWFERPTVAALQPDSSPGAAARAAEVYRAATAPSADNADSVAAVIARYVAAIGGADAIRSQRWLHQRSVTTGWGGQRMESELLVEHRKRVVARVWLNGKLQTEQGYDGSIAWEVDSRGAVSPLDAKRQADLMEIADLHAQHLEPVPGTRYAGLSRFESRPSVAIEFPRATGGMVSRHFDPVSGLLLGRVESSGTGSSQVIVTTYGDWRRHDGMLVAMRTTRRSGADVAVDEITTYESAPIPGDRFRAPRR